MAICFGIIQFEDNRSSVCIFSCKFSSFKKKNWIILSFCKYTEYKKEVFFTIDKKDHLCEEKITVPGWARTTNLSVNSRTR